jgi:CubicO group peptidase (beta-lactamase class C family)
MIPPFLRAQRSLLAAAFVFTSALAFAQAPGGLGSAVEAEMQKFVDRGVISGAVALVQRGPEIAMAEVGMSDLARQTPMRADKLFWIASMTKPMTAVCVAMLADEGRLSFDDPVQKHLPEFAGQWLITEESKGRRVLGSIPRPVTIRDLMTHTGGLGDVSAPRPETTLGELCMAYAREPLRFPPGAKWSYSNPGINTLGRIVEIVSGVPFAEFMQRRLFDPLGMRDTTFWPAGEQAGRIAKSYQPGKDGKLEEVPVYFIKGELGDRRRTAFPAGGLYSTAHDVAKFYAMMLAGGAAPDGRLLLKKETVAEMTRVQGGDEVSVGFAPGMAMGLGFQVVREPQGVTAMLSAGTFGHGGAYATQSWADPKTGAIFVLMIQRAKMPGGDMHEVRRAFQEAAANALK